MRGGAGDDIIRLYSTSTNTTLFQDIVRTNSLDAGSGDDDVRIEVGRYQRLSVDLGTGNDLLTFSATDVLFGQFDVTTGARADRSCWIAFMAMRSEFSIFTTLVVTDFTAGAGGDVLDLGGLVKGLLAFTTVAANPFADGHSLLIQDGADTIVLRRPRRQRPRRR